MLELWRTHKEFLIAFGAFLSLTGLTVLIVWKQSPHPELAQSEVSTPSPLPSSTPAGEVAGATTAEEEELITTNIQPTEAVGDEVADVSESSIGGNSVETESDDGDAAGETVKVSTASDSAQLITGYGSESREGKTVMYSLTFPESGGTVTGSVSGFCSGSALGEYDADTGLIKGLLSGRCENTEAEGEFSGVVRLSLGEATGTYKGLAGEQSDEGTWEIQFSPVD